MKSLLIQYIVLYSKAGYAPAAMILARIARVPELLNALVLASQYECILGDVESELAYMGAPAWLYNSLIWHLAEMRETLSASR